MRDLGLSETAEHLEFSFLFFLLLPGIFFLFDCLIAKEALFIIISNLLRCVKEIRKSS